MRNKFSLVFIVSLVFLIILLVVFVLKDKIFFSKKSEVETSTLVLPKVKVVERSLVDEEIEKKLVYDEKTNVIFLTNKRLPEGTKFYMPFRGMVIIRFEDLGRGLNKEKCDTYYFGLENQEKGYILDIVGPLKYLVPYNFYVLEKGTPFAEISYRCFQEGESFPIYISVTLKDKTLNSKEILKNIFPNLVK